MPQCLDNKKKRTSTRASFIVEKKCIKITPFIVNSNIYIIMHQMEFCFHLNINFTFSFPMNVYEI